MSSSFETRIGSEQFVTTKEEEEESNDITKTGGNIRDPFKRYDIEREKPWKGCGFQFIL